MLDDEASNDSPEHRLLKRREKAVRAGQRLPTEEELLRGMQFFRDQIQEDLREFGERLARRLRRRNRADLAPLVARLEELTVEQSTESLVALEFELRAAAGEPGVHVRPMLLRCLIYRASLGDSTAAAAIGGETLFRALKDLKASNDAHLLWTSLAWSAFARDLEDWERDGLLVTGHGIVDQRHNLRGHYFRVKEAINRYACHYAEKAGDKRGAPEAPADEAGHEAASSSAAAPSPPSGDTVVVLREVGNASGSKASRSPRSSRRSREGRCGCP